MAMHGVATRSVRLVLTVGVVAALVAPACVGDATGSDTACTDVDCSGHGDCLVDDSGAARCACDDGFTTDGLACVGAAAGPCDGVTCSDHGTCLPDGAAATCACDEGFHVDGTACLANTSPCDGVGCSSHGTCTADTGAAACVCDEGFVASGLSCTPVAGPCAGITCSAHGVCDDSSGAAECACDVGYHADALTCVANTSPCDGVPCSGHGTCDDSSGAAACVCEDGYTASGLSCVVPGDACTAVTCSDHGVCGLETGSPVCACDVGYHAVDLTCVQDAVDACAGQQCSNHGTCTPAGNTATCACDGGFHAVGLTCVADSGAAHPRIYTQPAWRDRLTAAIAADTAPATRFVNMVDGEVGGADYYAFAASDAALVYMLTGDAAAGTFAVDMIDARVSAEEALINAGQRAQVAGDSYLEVGPLIGDLALVYDWCFALLTPQQRSRWIAYANQAVWNVWHPDDAVWGGVSYPWSGWSIDNPSNNYYYSFLRATMLVGLATDGENPDAAGDLAWFRDTKIANQLVPTFTNDLTGGGSREGTGYGVAMKNLFELYDFWEATTGERLADLTPHTRGSLLWMMHATVPTLDWLAPTGDHARDSTAAIFDYHRAYVQELATLYTGETIAAAARTWTDECSVPEMGQFFMFSNDFLYSDPLAPRVPLNTLNTAYYGAGTGELFMRSSWNSNATWVSLIGGPYTESHAHHDQGHFMIYKNEWLVDDQNRRSHSGIRQEEELHNLVRLVRGGSTIRQRESAPQANLTALVHNATYSYARVDVTPIYNGDEDVHSVTRQLVTLWPNVVVVFDRIDVATGVDAVWQMNSPVPVTGSGMVRTLAPGSSTLTLRRILPVEANADASVFDWSGDGDMSDGSRFDIAQTSSGGVLYALNVLGVDGAVTAAAVANSTGVSLTLADGGTATVTFAADGSGGTLVTAPAAGPAVDVALGAGVATLGELAP